ncbi:MAG: DegV family protein [Eubacteriaceae bacterium]|nr:DegV family protein [Eubacteriaceae bacterium]MDD4508149.1 DegV family protein [Eubacteriaceae bacterium]
MESKIIMDSCVDFNDEAFDPDFDYQRIPFKILIDDEEIIDHHVNTAQLIDKMRMSKKKIGTACPSPNDFLAAIDPDKNNYIVTISSLLSGCHNSAMMAQKMAEEKGIKGNVHVFDSLSAATGESLTIMKITELIKRGLSPIDVIPIVRDYIANMSTYFLLNSLDNLAKNGRIRHTVALVGKVLKIAPIMMGNQGEIELKEKVRGKKKAFNRLAEIIYSEVEDASERILAITHVNALAQAEKLRDDIATHVHFKDILIFESSGLSTVYADNGGVIISY